MKRAKRRACLVWRGRRQRHSFHRRLETPAETRAGEARARNQENQVLAWLRARGEDARFTASEIHARAGVSALLTSVRRALTNLARAKAVVHHERDRRPGPYGVRQSTWSIAPERRRARKAS